MRRVVVYSQSHCEASQAEKAWLAARGIAFEERELDTSPIWRAELLALGSVATPTTVIESLREGRVVVIVGFLPDDLAEVLGLPQEVPAARSWRGA